MKRINRSTRSGISKSRNEGSMIYKVDPVKGHIMTGNHLMKNSNTILPVSKRVNVQIEMYLDSVTASMLLRAWPTL